MPSYEFYRSEFLGARINNHQDFIRLSARAGAFIERAERMWSVTYPDMGTPGFARKCAQCAVAEQLMLSEPAPAPASGDAVSSGQLPVKSVSTGSVSVTYNTVPAAELAASEERRCYDALRIYADVYRGV